MSEIFWSSTIPDKNKFDTIKNTTFVKPFGGLWTSPKVDDDFNSAWSEWCNDNMPEHLAGQRPYLLKTSGHEKIYIIDSKSDLEKCPTILPYKDIPLIKDNFPFSKVIDFEKMSQDYDAIRLTEKGLWETSDILNGISLYGWDVPSTLWMNWCFTKAIPRE